MRQQQLYHMLIYINVVIKQQKTMMKKKKPQPAPNNQLYRLPGAAVAVSHEVRLKQIYDSTYNNSKEKSPPKNSYKRAGQPSNRYHLPLTDRKSENKNAHYQTYLESEVMNQLRPNRRYHKRADKSMDKTELVSDNPIRRRSQNQSADMFKIRKSRQSSTSRKVSVSSLNKNQNCQALFEQARNLYKDGKFDRALPLFEECLVKDPDSSDNLYYTAIIYLNKKEYEKGLQLLTKICEKCPGYKKSIFLFAAISAKNLDKIHEAYDLCSQGLQEYPSYGDLYAYRAKICEMRSDYEQAHQDYEKILAHDKSNTEIYVKNADVLKKMGAYSNCLSNLASALYVDKGEFKKDILQRRVQINLQPSHFNLKQAKKDLGKLLAIEQKSSQVYYLKGKVLLHEGYKKQAILCFEQSLKQATEKQPMSKSLIEITKSKIDDRDFYSACYHINRSQYLELEEPIIEIYKLFTEGVVYLMKRKISQGDANFTKLVQKYPQICPYLKKIFYLYRAFSKFCLSDFQNSIKDYDEANNQEPIDIFAKFNKLLAQGIVEVNHQQYEKGIQYFDQAEKVIFFTKLNKIQPGLYRSATHIQKAKDLLSSGGKEMQQLKSLEEVFSALKELDKAYDINDSNSNMLYYRSLIYLHLGKYEQALQDIIKAISKSQQNVAKYFFFRALAHASLGNKKQALNDFNICNNLDEKFQLVYLQRAKIHFSNQNVTKGLEDLIKLKSINPKEDIKYHQACLNYVYGHNVMANACCDEIIDQQKAKTIKILIKTKMGRIKQAKKLATGEADLMIFQIIQGNIEIEEASTTELQFFTLYHYQHYLGIKQFLRGQYEKAIDMFVMATKERTLYDLQQGISNNSLVQEEEQEEQQQDDDNEKNTLHKINYNIFICYLLLGEWKKAYEVFIRDVIGVKQSLLKNQYMASFSHLLFQSMKSVEVPSQEKQVYELNLYQSKLNKALNEVVVELPNFILKTRICLLGMTNPKLEKIYKTKVDPDFILSYMKMSEIENRPEPPWVKREQSGLIFTDEIQNINVEFQTTENDEEEEQEDQDEQDEEGEEGEDQEQYEEDESGLQESSGQAKISVNKFKQKMKLDDSIERKLQKIMQRKQAGGNA